MSSPYRIPGYFSPQADTTRRHDYTKEYEDDETTDKVQIIVPSPQTLKMSSPYGSPGYFSPPSDMITHMKDSEDNVTHKVQVPPPLTVKEDLKELLEYPRNLLFSEDDPFINYRGQSLPMKLKLAFLYIFPISGWLVQSYKKEYLKGDIIAGITIASLAVPQDLGYANLAHLPPVIGLYSSFVPPLIYSLLGSSKDIAIGPVAVVSLLMGSLLREHVDPVTDPDNYLYFAFATTFFVGIIQLGMGICRLGFVIDFLSHSVVVGFMGGAAITISLQQLKGLLGYDCQRLNQYVTKPGGPETWRKCSFTTHTDVVSVMKSVFTQTDQFNYRPFLIGLFFLAFILATRFLATRRKKLFWAAATGPLLSIIVATAFVGLTHMDNLDRNGPRAVNVVGQIKSGINPSSLGHIMQFLKTNPHHVKNAAKVAVVTALIALLEAVAIARTFAAIKCYNINGNKEMVASGAMNLFGSMTSCYVTTGSFSRSAVNFSAGVSTLLSNIVMSVMVLITLNFAGILFRHLPTCVLSSIIFNAVLGLVDIRAAHKVWKTDKLDFIALLAAFFGVLFDSVEVGLAIAVAFSLIKLLLQVSRPRLSILGNIPGTTVYRNVVQYPDCVTTPQMLVVRIDSTMYFANSSFITERLRSYIQTASETATKVGSKLQYLILEMTPVMEIDTTAIHSIQELGRCLRSVGIQMALSNPNKVVLRKLASAGFLDELGLQWLFLSVDEAVRVCSMLSTQRCTIARVHERDGAHARCNAT